MNMVTLEEVAEAEEVASEAAEAATEEVIDPKLKEEAAVVDNKEMNMKKTMMMDTIILSKFTINKVEEATRRKILLLLTITTLI